jgi:hypothetical protein
LPCSSSPFCLTLLVLVTVMRMASLPVFCSERAAFNAWFIICRL